MIDLYPKSWLHHPKKAVDSRFKTTPMSPPSGVGAALGDIFYGNSIQGAGFDAIPASHAHVLKDHGLFKDAIELFDHFVGAGGHGNASPLIGVACFGGANVVAYRGE